MLPVIGVWCDSRHFTDLTQLTAIAGHSRAAAVGVLANQNVTGDQLLTVLARADLTAAHVAEVTPRAVMDGRSCEDQVAIVLATLERSEAAAVSLTEWLTPDAALRLHRRATTSRFRGAARLAGAVASLTGYTHFQTYSAHPAYLPLLRSVRGEDDLTVLMVEASNAMGDPDALLALTDRIAAVGKDDFHDRDRETLLLATAGYPDVVAHWAAHGGRLGKLVAATDHRQPVDLLLSLRGKAARLLLLGNPRVPLGVRNKMVARELRRLLDKDQYGYREFWFSDLVDQVDGWQSWWDGVDVDDLAAVTSKQAERLCNSSGRRPITRLLAYEVLTQAKLKGSARVALLEPLLWLYAPNAHLADLVRGWLPKSWGEDYTHYQLGEHLSRCVPEVLATHPLPENCSVEDTSGLTVAQLRKGMKDAKLSLVGSVDEYGHGWTVGAADVVCRRFSTAAQYHELYRRLGNGQYAWQVPLLPLLEEIVAEHPDAGDTGAALRDLVGSGLGTL